MNPIDELKLMQQQLAGASTMDELRSIFYRLDAIAKGAPDDLDVQVAVGDMKQSLVVLGKQLTGTPDAAGHTPSPATPVCAPDSFERTAIHGQDRLGDRTHHPPQPVSAPTADPLPAEIPFGLPAPGPAPESKKTSGVSWLIGILVLLAGGAGAVYWFYLRPTPLYVQIETTPQGAAVSVDGQLRCSSDCNIPLGAGKHEISAKLDGYTPASTSVDLAANQVLGPVKLSLSPIPQSLRILSELGLVNVILDDEKPSTIKDGWFLREAIAPGHHKLRVLGQGREVKFSFDITPGSLPTPSGTVSTKNALAVMVSTMGAHGRLCTSPGPWKLTVNGTAESEAGPAGVALRGYKTGENELVLGEGAGVHRIKGVFVDSPALTIFLKQAQDGGTLTIATQVDDVRVFINDREQPERTKGGQLRVRVLGPVTVRVAKDGFDSPAPKMAEIEKDQDVRMLFTLTEKSPLPSVAERAEPRAAAVAEPPPKSEARPESPPPPPPPATSRVPTSPVSPPPAPPPASTPAKNPDPSPATSARIANRPTRGIEGFEDPGAWRMESGLWHHRGQAFLAYKAAAGLFTFTVKAVRGGHARWSVNYSNPRNYRLFELDDESLAVVDIANGKRTSRAKVRHEAQGKDRQWMMQVSVSPDRVIHSILRDRNWVVLDSRPAVSTAPGDGTFGFLVLGDEEIALSTFQFAPR